MGREMGWRFKDGGEIYLWLIHVDVWQKHNFVKQLSFNEKKIKNLKKEGKHLQNKKCEFWKPLGEAWSLNKHVG